MLRHGTELVASPPPEPDPKKEILKIIGAGIGGLALFGSLLFAQNKSGTNPFNPDSVKQPPARTSQPHQPNCEPVLSARLTI